MSVFVAIKPISIMPIGYLISQLEFLAFDEVVEFYRMSGDVDYMLRVVVPNMAAYDAFYKRPISEVALTDVSSSFAMEQKSKYQAAPPSGPR